MGTLSRLFGRVPQTEAAQRARRIWAQMPSPDLETALARVRCVVTDTETAGLDPHRDALISVAACRIESGAVAPARAFDVMLQQQALSGTDNVLVHGIGHAAQAGGAAPDTALADYLAFARRDLVVGFHTRFDLVVLERAIQAHLGIAYRPPYLDLALILPALLEAPKSAQWALDDWIGHFALQPVSRHSALSDAFVTAQLCLLCFARAASTGYDGLHRLLRLQKRVLEERAQRG